MESKPSIVEIRKHMENVAFTLCNDLKPGDPAWGTQITYEVDISTLGIERGVRIYMADIEIGTFRYGDGGDMPEGFGRELAKALMNAGPAIFNLLARVAWLESHLARTITSTSEIFLLQQQEIADLKEANRGK